MTVVLDTDVILIDYRYKWDTKFGTNRAALDAARAAAVPLEITTQALLEVVGILSYNVAAAQIPLLPDAIQTEYQLTVFPSPVAVPDYAGVPFDEVVYEMRKKMNLGDAVQAAQLRKFGPDDGVLLTWNAKHFVGKVGIPVMTPEEWLQQNPSVPPPAAGPTP
ncbi:MAG: hypothetical protein K2X87_26510 [Gemmataceae bacterium]|nr:hypothetical protein [Gemmataceae bacterium]